MPRTKRDTTESLQLRCDDAEDTFVVKYTNQGDPFREGITIGVTNMNFDKEVTVMLESREAMQLRDLLNKHYPI